MPELFYPTIPGIRARSYHEIGIQMDFAETARQNQWSISIAIHEYGLAFYVEQRDFRDQKEPNWRAVVFMTFDDLAQTSVSKVNRLLFEHVPPQITFAASPVAHKPACVSNRSIREAQTFSRALSKLRHHKQ